MQIRPQVITCEKLMAYQKGPTCSRSILGILQKDVPVWSPWKSESQTGMQEVYYEYSRDQSNGEEGEGAELGQESWGAMQ